jgi:hypothetical protein
VALRCDKRKVHGFRRVRSSSDPVHERNAERPETGNPLSAFACPITPSEESMPSRLLI